MLVELLSGNIPVLDLGDSEVKKKDKIPVFLDLTLAIILIKSVK